MSVLVRQQILELMETGDLYIGPLVTEKQVGKVTVDLRLGTMASIVRGNRLAQIDPRAYVEADRIGKRSLEESRRRKLETINVAFGDPLVLHAGSLTLASTFEWVKLPNYLQGVVTARSSWAREGLSIATATFIDPCYNGIVTLELENFGQTPITVYPGMRLAQMALYQLNAALAEECDDSNESQFNFSFEPGSGDITKDDRPFIPTSPLEKQPFSSELCISERTVAADSQGVEGGGGPAGQFGSPR